MDGTKTELAFEGMTPEQAVQLADYVNKLVEQYQSQIPQIPGAQYIQENYTQAEIDEAFKGKELQLVDASTFDSKTLLVHIGEPQEEGQ